MRANSFTGLVAIGLVILGAAGLLGSFLIGLLFVFFLPLIICWVMAASIYREINKNVRQMRKRRV